MQVLRIIASMDPASGGPCQGIRNIIPELEREGIHNEVVSLDDPLSTFIGGDPFNIVALGPAKGPWNYSEKLVPWLLDNLHRFDVVIVHGLWLYHGYAVKKSLSLIKKKAVNFNSLPRLFVMPHGMLDPYFQRASERRLKALRNWVYWKFIENKIINNADGLLFTCEAELRLARQPFHPYHPKQEINIGYGVQSPPAYELIKTNGFFEKCPQVRDQPFLLFLSRIHEKKGVDHLVEAYEQVISQCAIEKINFQAIPKLVIAGPGLESAFGQKMQQKVAQSPLLGENVFFPGMLSGDAKWAAFYACEAFILPSHQENFGIAVVEAMACGKPVLISNQVNIWTEIIEAGAGLAADDSTKGVKQLLNSWQCLDREEKIRMGLRALDCFKKDFTIRAAGKRFTDLVVTQIR